MAGQGVPFEKSWPKANFSKSWQAPNKKIILKLQRMAGHGVPFGKTQFPELFDYADDVDVINFLANT